MVYAIGESLYDITLQNFLNASACPGGSMLNTAVSLARWSVPVMLLSEIGNDNAGKLILEFLNSNQVKTELMHTYEGKTSLALATLNENCDAVYEFYLFRPEFPPVFSLPVDNQGDYLLFGSNYARQSRNQPNILRLAGHIKSNGGHLMYDPNFRKISGDRENITNLMIGNISISDIVRGSDEDFFNLFGLSNGEEVYQKILSYGVKILIYTRNRMGVDLFTPWLVKHYESIDIQVVSTIGAGDSFNAGLLAALHKKIKIPESENFWDQAIHQAIIFASEVCASNLNFVDWPKID